MEEEYVKIGKIDINKIGKYKKLIMTEEVIFTQERFSHVMNEHAQDLELYINSLVDIIENPNYILEDHKNINTLMFIKYMEKTNINVIVRLAIEDKKHSKNSIMTFYRLREKNLKKLQQKNKTIYKNE